MRAPFSWASRSASLFYLGRLGFGRHVLVQDPNAAFLGQRDGETGFGNRVHGGGHDRQIQLDGARQPGPQADFAGQDWNGQELRRRHRR